MASRSVLLCVRQRPPALLGNASVAFTTIPVEKTDQVCVALALAIITKCLAVLITRYKVETLDEELIVDNKLVASHFVSDIFTDTGQVLCISRKYASTRQSEGDQHLTTRRCQRDEGRRGMINVDRCDTR